MSSNRKLVISVTGEPEPGWITVILACDHTTMIRRKKGKLPLTVMCPNCLTESKRSLDERKGKG